MRLVITGAGGMLGQDVAEEAASAGFQVVALTRSELDVTDRRGVRTALMLACPDVVINCAAYTNVDAAQEDRHGALTVNADGAGHVAMAAAELGAWTVQVSTDYVFDGERRVPYRESDEVDPMSVYGQTKLEGERRVEACAPDSHTIVRTSWLFGTGGPCFPATMLRLASERDELSVVDDQVGCPTFTGHLAAALVGIASDRTPGVLHVAATGECSWFEFAREIMARAGVDVRVNPCTTAEFPRPAPRPAYSVLRSERGAPELPTWQDGLDAYLAAPGVRS